MHITTKSLLILLLCVSCGTPQKDKDSLDQMIEQAISADNFELITLDGIEVLAKTDQKTPFSGLVKMTHENGKIKAVSRLKHGVENGLCIIWHENGRKAFEANFNMGNIIGIAKEWDINGTLLSQSK